MKNMLVVSGYIPYPPIHGGKIDVWNNIKILYELGFQIDLVVTEKNINIDKNFKNEILKYVDKIFIVRRKNKLNDVFSIIPLQIKSRELLKNINFEKKYKYILLEGDYVSEILKNKTLIYDNVLLRSQNNEYEYFYNLSKSTGNLLYKVYYFSEYLKFKFYVPKLYRIVKNILFISCDEKKFFHKSLKNLNAIFLPANVKMDFKKQPLNTYNVLFIGSLFMENNKDGIMWYLNNIHPIVSRKNKNYKLIIAGNSNGTDLEWIFNYRKKFKNIEIYNSPETLDDLYKISSVFINPMRYGAGVKLKTVEAIINGLPVISTTIGKEGTGLKNNKEIIVRDSIDDFSNAVINLLSDNDLKHNMVDSGQEYIKNNYNSKEILKKYLDSFECFK